MVSITSSGKWKASANKDINGHGTCVNCLVTSMLISAIHHPSSIPTAFAVGAGTNDVNPDFQESMIIPGSGS